jgi:DNA (cytosine-5)-methyltransferase 1
MKNHFTSFELFAGAGGLALGLSKAGFNHIGLLEYDKNACQTLRTNKPNWNVYEKDITSISEENFQDAIDIPNENLDLLSGGFPCQAFSYAGNRLGLEDTRGTLFYYYALFLKKLRPKMFLAENVKGLVSHDSGKTLATILEIFRQLNYSLEFKVLNAWDYKVPQKRERIFIIGRRNDINQALTYNFPDKQIPKPLLKDVLYDVPESPGIKYSEYKKGIMDLVPPGGSWINLPLEIQKEYLKGSYFLGGGKRGIARRMSFDEPSLTLTCSPAMKQTERCHPLETRPFTTREYARIQTFPDSWKFAGRTLSIYRQIGNAVPVNLAYHVGLEIIKSIKGYYEN